MIPRALPMRADAEAKCIAAVRDATVAMGAAGVTARTGVVATAMVLAAAEEWACGGAAAWKAAK